MFNSRKRHAESAASAPAAAPTPAAVGVAKFSRRSDAAAPPDAGGDGRNGNVARALFGDAFRGTLEASPAYVDAKLRLHQRLIDMINLPASERMKPEEFRAGVAELVHELVDKEQIPLNAGQRTQLESDIIDEMLGLGPIEPLLKDPTVSDILVNTHQQVYVERFGQIVPTAVKFKDNKHLLRIIDKIVSRVGRRVDESQPMVDARLPDGSRVNAAVPPVAVDGPLLSIRKFAKIPLDIPKLIEVGSLTSEIADVLSAIVRGRLNVIISGGTGTGKTTVLNALSSFISDRERIITIEDAAELQLQQPHVARMETRPPNIEGKGEIAQRELVKNALRMRPDRIIVGEVRAGEAFDMLQAMNTGHDGSMTTIHANSCRDALSRLEQMIGMTGLDLPVRSMRKQIASAIQVVLQLQRFADGRRRLVSFHEITGMEGDVISMQEIFRYKQLGIGAQGEVVGEFLFSGIRPTFFDRFQTTGIFLPSDILENKRRPLQDEARR
jgi:pilus assembly protein CpaF